MLSWYSGDKNMIEPFKMEEDPDGTSQQVAVIMTGKVYREAGLKQSKHPEVEGMLYDKLCQIGKHKLRDDVRRMALSIALSVRDKEFRPTIAWLDNFMRRFCLSKKKMGFHSTAMLKQKGSMQREVKPAAPLQNMTQEDVFSVLGFSADIDPTPESEDTGRAATSGQTTVQVHSSQSGTSLANCNENKSNSETNVESNGNDTSGTGDEVNISDANTSTTDNADIPVHKKDGACNENDEKLEERVDKETDTVLNQEISSSHDINKENCDKVEEVVILDNNDDDETIAAQNLCGSDSKIGKISIKKFEDLCETSIRKEKDSGKTSMKETEDLCEGSSTEENSKEGKKSDSSDESEDDSEQTTETDSEKNEKASESDSEASQQSTVEDGTESITYSKAETKYYNKNQDALQKRLKESVMKCTSCYEQVNHHIRSLVFTHPVLGLFICKKCRKYYGKGKFRKDREGYDEYCRLCAEGGDLLCCEQEDCFNGFCKRCVKRTMGRGELKHAETTEGWSCYVCNPEPLMELRALHRLILSNLRSSEKEDANLSRKDLKSKTLKNKFESLKQMRQMRSQREAPPSRSKNTEPDKKNCMTDNNVSEVEEEKAKRDNGKTCSKITEKDKEVPKKSCKKTDVSIPEDVEDNKPCPVLRNAIDEMLGMLSKCLENMKIIDSKWKRSKYSSVGTKKARHNVLKQLEAMRNNFGILEGDLLECSQKEMAKENTTVVKENNKDQSVRELKIKSTASKIDKPDDVEQMDSETTGNKEEENISDQCQSSGKMVSSEKDGKISEKGNGRKNGTDTSEQVDFDLAAAASDKHANSVDHYEDSSQHSSKACLPSDDEHSLPDLVDVIKEIISDPDEPMDVEEKMTMIKSLDMENEVPELLGNVKQKRKTRQKSDSKLTDGIDKESSEDDNALTSYSEDKEISNTKICNNRRTRSASVDSRSGSDAEVGKRVQKQHKKMRLEIESDESKQRNGIVNEAGKASNKTKKVVGDKSHDSEEEFDKILAENIDKTHEELEDRAQRSVSIGNDSKLESDVEINKKTNQKSSQLHKRRRLSRDADEDDTEKEGNLSMQGRGNDIKKDNEKVENKEVGDGYKKNNEESAISSHVESDGEELTTGNMNKNKKKLRKKDAQKSRDGVCETDDKEEDGRGTNTPVKGPNEGNMTDTETSKIGEHESSSEEKTVIKKENKSSDDCNVSNAGKSDQRKRKCNMANGAEEKRTTRSNNKQSNNNKGRNEEMEDDTHSGFGRKSETSEEDSDKEIKRQSENDAKKECNVSNPDKRDQRKKKSTMAKDEETKTTRSKKKQRNKNKKRQKEELEDDIRLGLVNKSETSEEDSDEENQRQSEDDSEEKKGKPFKLEKKWILDSEKEEEEEEKDIDSAEMKDIESCPSLAIKKEKDLESDEDKESDMELPVQNKEKNVPKKKGSSVKKENQKAKAAILQSNSEDELEDKPKPRSKKKYYKRHMNTQTKRKSHKKLKLKLTEEEMEELKGKQLDGRCQVLVETLSSEVRKKLEEEEFIYTSDHPELKYPILQRQISDSDGCADDEEDSDKEFSKLMKFKCGKIKPGPKSKSAKLKLKLMGGEGSDDCDDLGSPDIEGAKVNGISESPDEDADNETDGEGKMESTDKKKKKKVIRKKKEGLLDIDIDEDCEEENEDEVEEDMKKKKKDGGISLNEKMKKHILMSSDEEEEEEDQKDNSAMELEEAEREKQKHEKKKEAAKKKAKNEDSEEEYAPKVYKKGYMNLNISTDEEEELEKKKGKASEKEEEKEEEEEEEPESAYEDDSDFEESPKKRRAFQISSSDSESGNKNKKTRKKVTTEDESEEEEEKPKSRRKRIRKMSSSDDDDDDDDDGEVNKESPSKHKKIRKVIRDEDLMETTKNATQEEEERRKRIAERQKNYNEIFLVDVETDQKDMDKLVLDFDPETKSELVSVHEKLVKSLKPHQFKGIKFMWDATVESLEQLKTGRGGGCILAHSMGLGKTLQVITFCHTLLTNKSVSKEIQRIMVCCPVNTIFNWVAEFSSWLKGKMLPFDVIELASAKDLWGRAYRLDDWWREGGICIIGYSMFRNLSNSKNKRYKGKMKEIFQKTLVDPGPDLVVCDEGHMIKNEKTALSVAINKVRTMRRIILTGTPLQNNLKEYHCMIQFVKPNLLGTKKEFMNRFSNPIEQGQCVEAMPRDVRRMKRRAHILHNLLEGCVQRFDYTVLKPYLPPKFEYVISVQLSDIQRKLYQYYLDSLARGGGGGKIGSGLFVDFGILSRVWTHPKVLELAMRRAAYDDEEELDDFICDDSTTSDSSDDERSKRKKARNKKDEESEEEENNDTEEADEPDQLESNAGLTASGKVRMDWWKKVLIENAGEDFEEEEYLDQLEHSGKLILLLDILRECCSIGDKVLLFSQSLLALDVIEDFLHGVDQGEIELPKAEDSLPLPYKFWKRERDYLRLDGSTPPDTRKTMCRIFNDSNNERCRLFLISTRAGGLGINLVGANRVIIFDSSWNPSHDTQSIFRVYRFGQKKPCYIYRFVAQGTMEEKIYSRQVTKESTALRVVDEHQIKRYFKMTELAQLYEFNPADTDVRETPIVPKDRLLAELLQRQKNWIVTYHEHESLLENQTNEELSEEERKAAWEDYENEKKGFMVQNHRSVMPVMGAPTMLNHPGLPSVSLSSFSFEGVVNTIKAQNPNLSHLELCESVLLATKQIQKVHLNHYQRVQAMVYNLKNPMIAPEQRKLLPFGNHPEMLPMLEQQLRLLEENIQRENQVITHIDQGTAQRNQLLSTASLMSAGLLHGQPTSSGVSSVTANYVERPSSSSAGRPPMSRSETSKEKKTGSNDVILLD